MLVLLVVNCCDWLSPNIVMFTMYITITPFWSSGGGGTHVNATSVGEIALPIKETGELEGAVKKFKLMNRNANKFRHLKSQTLYVWPVCNAVCT